MYFVAVGDMMPIKDPIQSPLMSMEKHQWALNQAPMILGESKVINMATRLLLKKGEGQVFSNAHAFTAKTFISCATNK